MVVRGSILNVSPYLILKTISIRVCTYACMFEKGGETRMEMFEFVSVGFSFQPYGIGILIGLIRWVLLFAPLFVLRWHIAIISMWRQSRKLPSTY